MEVIEYTKDKMQEWDEFVIHSNNGTMFHLQKFLSYHPAGKFKWHHLMFYQKGKLIAVLPGTLENGVYESPIGASYGSFVTKDIKFKTAMELVSSLLDYGKAQKIKEILLTPPPLIYEEYPNQNIEFALRWQGFEYQLHYISSAIKLADSRPVIPRFQSTVRRNIRKTLRDPNIRVEVNERYDEFYPILLKNKARHGVKPTHTYEELLLLNKLLPGYLKLFMVYWKDIPIGGSLMFYPNRFVALCFYNMLLYEYARFKPIQRVMYEVVKDATERGFRYVDIGVSQDTKAENPMTPSMSLIDFKEKFDAKTIMRNTLYIKL